jgi:L-threonylcarbamoyladenylate synthase
MSIISNCTASAIKASAISLIGGNLVAFPTETVYGLGADATNKDAVARIYEVKGRPSDHPLIVHISSIKLLDKWARDIPEYAIKLARAFWPGPVTLILPRTELAKNFITGNQDNVAIRVPSHSIAQALICEFEAQGGIGIVAPSANRFGKVSPTNADAVMNELGKLLHNKDIILNGGSSQVGIESTIVDCTQDKPIILRPGSITKEMIDSLLSLETDKLNLITNKISAPGLLKSHYAPDARIFLDGTPSPGDGFIALSNIPTPLGVIRLASPENNGEFARVLYSSLNLADQQSLKKVYIIAPTGGGIAEAICDRINKASYC